MADLKKETQAIADLYIFRIKTMFSHHEYALKFINFHIALSSALIVASISVRFEEINFIIFPFLILIFSIFGLAISLSYSHYVVSNDNSANILKKHLENIYGEIYTDARSKESLFKYRIIIIGYFIVAIILASIWLLSSLIFLFL